jgi:hypothetical protein
VIVAVFAGQTSGAILINAQAPDLEGFPGHARVAGLGNGDEIKKPVCRAAIGEALHDP